MTRAGCAVLFTLLATAASAQAVKTTRTAAGATLQTQSGDSLYVYDGDEVNRSGQGRSSCVEQCAAEWPPFLAQAGAKPHGPWSLITRSDGKKQWAYKDRPLYTYVKASTPDATSGNGANGNRWHLAKP